MGKEKESNSGRGGERNRGKKGKTKVQEKRGERRKQKEIATETTIFVPRPLLVLRYE